MSWRWFPPLVPELTHIWLLALSPFLCSKAEAEPAEVCAEFPSEAGPPYLVARGDQSPAGMSRGAAPPPPPPAGPSQVPV